MNHLIQLTLLITIILLISCGQNEKDPMDRTANLKKEKIERLIEIIENDDLILTFDEIFATTLFKKLPYIETTNFDNFIDSDDYKEFDPSNLKLDKIYPNFNKENYKAIAKYKIVINTHKFHTIVVTIKKGDHEMESILINYNLKGNIIDHQIVAYDEIAESLSRVESRISENRLTVNHIFWAEEKQIEQVQYEIKDDGTIERIDSQNLYSSIPNFSLVQKVLNQLQLKEVQVKTNLIASKTISNNTEETIVVIPEVYDESNHYFELNNHTVIVNNKTGEITHKYFEDSKTNLWVSDAIMLQEITIDTAPYNITNQKRAFGIRVEYIGTSRANPYIQETIALFIKSDDNKLRKILPSFNTMDYGGEWDTDCIGEFLETNKVLIISQDTTNKYYDILVNSKITTTINFKDEDGNCDSKETVINKNSVLIFDQNAYLYSE